MKIISASYIFTALFCITFWAIWFYPNKVSIIGYDGSWFFGIGIIALWLIPIQIIMWVFPKIRNGIFSSIGIKLGYTCYLTSVAFWFWGMYIILMLAIYGI